MSLLYPHLEDEPPHADMGFTYPVKKKRGQQIVGVRCSSNFLQLKSNKYSSAASNNSSQENQRAADRLHSLSTCYPSDVHF
jgi:hypothetical protein